MTTRPGTCILCGMALLLAVMVGCRPEANEQRADAPRLAQGAVRSDSVLTAGFVGLARVFNTELMAPYDVLQHTDRGNAARYVEPFVVSPDGEPFRTFEGLAITPHYSFADAPPIDILVIPSTGNSLDADLENERLIQWLDQAVRDAQYVVTVCWGAFPLAATGALDGRAATTFPSSQERFADQFPAIDVRRDVHFVVDGKFITAVGDALSYEPAFYLVETLFSKGLADDIAQGLVWDWKREAVPHEVVQPLPAIRGSSPAGE